MKEMTVGLRKRVQAGWLRGLIVVTTTLEMSSKTLEKMKEMRRKEEKVANNATDQQQVVYASLTTRGYVSDVMRKSLKKHYGNS